MMNNRLSFLVRKHEGKMYMADFLSEISKLLNVKDYQILDIERYDKISESINKHTKESVLKGDFIKIENIPFEDKGILKDVFNVINQAYCDKIYMSIGYSDICGIILIEKLETFNTDFKYFDEHSGLIVFNDIKLENKLILDFYEDDNMYYYDIEIYGKYWVELNRKSC